MNTSASTHAYEEELSRHTGPAAAGTRPLRWRGVDVDAMFRTCGGICGIIRQLRGAQGYGTGACACQTMMITVPMAETRLHVLSRGMRCRAATPRRVPRRLVRAKRTCAQ